MGEGQTGIHRRLKGGMWLIHAGLSKGLNLLQILRKPLKAFKQEGDMV